MRQTRKATRTNPSDTAAPLVRYEDARGDSGIAAYALGPDSITVRFKHGGTYLYTAASTGRNHINAMKKLAVSNDGLNTYISQQVRDNYAVKLS